MIIGIDGNEANQKIRTGSGVYAFELLKQFKQFKEYQISNPPAGRAGIKYQIYLKNDPIDELPGEDKNFKYKVVGPDILWTQMGLPFKLWKEKMFRTAPDVFFTPTHYAPRFCPVPSVITIFDLSFIRFPEMFLKKDLYQLKNWTEYSLKQAKKIITISEFSKKEIVDHYQVTPEKIIVAYPGYDKKKFKVQSSKFKVEEIKKKYKIERDYLLYVGTVQPRKNLVRLIEAFKLVIKRHPKLKLVICGMIKEGRGGWMNDEILHQVQNSKIKTQNNIVITGFINEGDLPYLMAGAKAYVLPSLYEGFGIPVVEAMAVGIPVVVSNVSSLPELVGNAGILIDPYKIEDIAKGIIEACYNNQRREEYIMKGFERIKVFNWAKSCQKIITVLTEIGKC